MSSSQEPGIISPESAATASISVAQSLVNTSIPTAAHSVLSALPRGLFTRSFRAVNQSENITLLSFPKHVARLVGLEGMTSRFWGASSESDVVAATAQAAAGAVGEGIVEPAVQVESTSHISDIMQAALKFSGFFSYLTSRWSLACFTVALLLNRITIYASTRRHLNLDWHRRLALRMIPIVLFLSQILTLLRAIRCQTSPDYPLLRYGNPGKRLLFDHAGSGGFLYSLGSTLLPWESDEESCSAVHMLRPTSGSEIAYGSFTLLWPVFLRLCLSHFVETLSCALQGRPVVTEAGMSIFEHSLAFAEAESTIKEGGKSTLQLLTRAQVLERMNVSPELLLIALISCCNSLTSNILDVVGKQSRYRLFNTAFWGLCFMFAMAWGILNGSSTGADLVLKFPTVCIVGFVPHLLILLGIIACGTIYSIALVITAFSLPMDVPLPLSLRQRLLFAHENMQGSSQIHSVRLNRHEDFYTTLLRIGYTALTAASEAVFLNEGKGVVARNMTWLEEDRLSEIEESRRHRHQNRGARARDVPFGGGESMDFDIPDAPSDWESGYGREKKIEKAKNGSRAVRAQTDLGGVGAFRGVVRCYHGFAFFRGIFFLLLRWSAHGLDKLLAQFSITARPQWFKAILGPRRRVSAQKRSTRDTESLDFWILTDEGQLRLPGDREFDVEKEMRKRERSSLMNWEQTDERRLDEKLYNWWKAGGSWGNQDQSPDFSPPVDDFDDTTSVVSISTAADSEWEEESDGRRTPTRDNPFPDGFSRDSTPAPEAMMDISSFARLLDPRDQESRQEARILAAHLSAGQEGRILTRHQFQKQVERERAQILVSSRLPPFTGDDGKRKPNAEEESEILEKLILSRRDSPSASGPPDAQTWESGASGLGPSGPPCVICHTNPRSIITWPCRCLCVCEECRVSLAMNNFGSCVTCRQEVGGFVRLWVP
ncbi:hypothetical protein FE257_011701 [Aspergillus nanangensis]|uniref:Ubiquitin-protein ligase n=1 Tax=Aspergillus nanangensis TaxID=2582783 RepID=A0AAD4CVF1_ASPNN|nr:hypothetical protein FE257_011701 [Aspergillus nanangensis]